jgi:hypothetical protein
MRDPHRCPWVPAVGGGRRRSLRSCACQGPCDCGDEILVFTREQDPGRPDYDVRREQRDGMQVVWVNNLVPAHPHLCRHLRQRGDRSIADRVIDEFEPDVAHIHHLTCLDVDRPFARRAQASRDS